MPKANPLTAHDHINRLFDMYAPLLTIRQQEIMTYYFHYDLSLQEIAKELNISRAGVSAAIKQSKDRLSQFELIVGMVDMQTRIQTIIDDEKTPLEIKKKLFTLLNR
jgi:predicted DNA-binding protein YlxM (UPF0122 family)